MDITFYLIELLRLHDCVIVPELGGFVTNYRPAEMDLANNRFNPPVKEVIFTSKLSKNDGLLVNYISEIEGVGYLEARQIVAEFVDETWSKLENGDRILFQNIGSLKFDRNEKLIFEPEVKGNFLLEAYGMEGFQFPQLQWKELTPTKRIFADKDASRRGSRAGKVKAFAIGIPIVLALILVPVSKNAWNSQPTVNLQTSSTAPLPVIVPLVNAVTPKVAVEPIDQPVETKVEVETPVVKEAVVPVKVLSTAASRYRIIGGCFNIRENAQNFLERLQKDGYTSELKVMPNGTFLIVVQAYADKSEAFTALQHLQEADPKSGYWVSRN
jgi:hypothetical protein